MANLFDQFESSIGGNRATAAAARQNETNPFGDDGIDIPSVLKTSQQKPVSRAPQEFPLFRKQESTKIRVPSHISCMTVSNNVLTVAVLGNSIFRFDTKTSSHIDNTEIKRDDDVRIYKIFQDPRAQHLLVCMESKEVYYIGSRGGVKRPQPRLLSKVKGHLIESVAWNKLEQTDQSTGTILLGTSNGTICETVVDVQDKKKYLQEVYHLMPDMTGSAEPVTGIHMEMFPRNQGGNEGKHFILVTTPCRIYQFIGCVSSKEPYFADMFAFYNDSVKIQFQEIPGSPQSSTLCVWPPYSKDPPQSFAWLTGAGVYYGTMVLGDNEPGESGFVEKNLIPYSVISETGEEKDAKVEWNQKDLILPIGLSLTEFHCVLLYRDKLVAVCHLNNKKVFDEGFDVRRHGPLYSLSTDPVSRCMWTHAKVNFMMFTPHNEARNVWKIFLDQERFDLAKKFADGSRRNLDTILVREAEYYFKKRKYEDAAIVFSKSRLSFEEVALKFIQVNKKEALKLFLKRKLSSLSEKDSTQLTMLSTWLCELYLNELGTLHDSSAMDQYQKLQEEFHKFLATPSLRASFEENSKTIYDIMASHGAIDDVIHFAKIMEDYDKVISHYIQQYKYEEALVMLREQAARIIQSSSKSEVKAKFSKCAALYYKFSPVLVKHTPQLTVEAWIEADKLLNPKRLIPSLIQCNQSEWDKTRQQEQTTAEIKYLEFCVNHLKSNDISVHNFLISSYANSEKQEDHEKLLNYLMDQAKEGLSPSYDTQYVLRLCIERRLDEPCVYIYATMGLYEEAVSLALKTNKVKLAKRMIGMNHMVRKDSQLQKKLWLKIAEYVIKENKDIQTAMQVLKECSVLKIEDILPFFSDVVTIDQFKDAICDSLQTYNSHIDLLKKEMQGATESARNIRSDIQEIRNKCVLIHSDQKCHVCEGRLLSQPFYMFPCHHAFHRDCLVIELKDLLPPKTRLRVEQLIKLIDQQMMQSSTSKGRLAQDKSDLDDIIASDCPYCGLIMIQSISLPLLPLDSLHKTLSLWN